MIHGCHGQRRSFMAIGNLSLPSTCQPGLSFPLLHACAPLPPGQDGLPAPGLLCPRLLTLPPSIPMPASTRPSRAGPVLDLCPSTPSRSPVFSCTYFSENQYPEHKQVQQFFPETLYTHVLPSCICSLLPALAITGKICCVHVGRRPFRESAHLILTACQ